MRDIRKASGVASERRIHSAKPNHHLVSGHRVEIPSEVPTEDENRDSGYGGRAGEIVTDRRRLSSRRVVKHHLDDSVVERGATCLTIHAKCVDQVGIAQERTNSVSSVDGDSFVGLKGESAVKTRFAWAAEASPKLMRSAITLSFAFIFFVSFYVGKFQRSINYCRVLSSGWSPGGNG